MHSVHTHYSHTDYRDTHRIDCHRIIITHQPFTRHASLIVNHQSSITHQSHTLRISHHSSLLPHHHHYHQHYLTLPPTHHSSLSLSPQHHHYIYHSISQTRITHTHTHTLIQKTAHTHHSLHTLRTHSYKQSSVVYINKRVISYIGDNTPPQTTDDIELLSIAYIHTEAHCTGIVIDTDAGTVMEIVTGTDVRT
jgi:hypothetical protein